MSCKKCMAECTDEFCSDRCKNNYYQKQYKQSNTKMEKDYVKSGARAYNNIKQRCSNPNHPMFDNYGRRGIFLTLTFEEFRDIYFGKDNCENCGTQLDDNNRNGKQGRTLDRIDQARGYEKGNLRILCRSCNSAYAIKRRKNRA